MKWLEKFHEDLTKDNQKPTKTESEFDIDAIADRVVQKLMTAGNTNENNNDSEESEENESED